MAAQATITADSDAPSSAMITGISVVVPAWDDESTIAYVVEALCSALDTLVYDYEIIVVDDGSVDATVRLVEELAVDHDRMRVLHHDTHQGYGAVWRTGLTVATKPYVVFMDADPLLFDPSALARLLCWGDSYDLVIAYCPDPRYPRGGSLVSWCLATLVHILFGMRRWDIARGFVLGRTALLQEMHFVSTGFLINAEVLYRARQRGARLRETTVEKHRRYPENPEHLRQPMQRIDEAIALWWRLKRSTSRQIAKS